MITKHDIIKMAKHVAKRSAGLPDSRLMHPNRDWTVGFLFAVVLLVAGAAHAGVTFYAAWSYNPDTYSVEVSTVTYRDKLVNEVIETYRTRAEQYDALRSNRVIVKVPEPNESPTDEIATSSDAVGATDSQESVATSTEGEV